MCAQIGILLLLMKCFGWPESDIEGVIYARWHTVRAELINKHHAEHPSKSLAEIEKEVDNLEGIFKLGLREDLYPIAPEREFAED